MSDLAKKEPADGSAVTLPIGIGDISGGLLSGLVSVIYGFSFAAMIFAGPSEAGLTLGIAMALMTSTIYGIVVALCANVRFAVAGVDIYTAVSMAVLLLAVSGLASDTLSESAHLATLAASLMVSTALLGIFLSLLYLFHLGDMVRYVPYTVIAGFLASTGLMIGMAGLGITTGLSLSVFSLPDILDSSYYAQLAAMIAAAVFISVACALYKHRLAFSTAVLAVIAVFYLTIHLMGIEKETLEKSGWVFALDAASINWLPWYLVYDGVDWAIFREIVPEIIALCFIGVIAIMINICGAELLVSEDGDLNRDVGAFSIASLLSAAGGGFAGGLSMSRTTVNQQAGGEKRVSGVVCALVSFGVLFVGADLVNLVPRFVYGALMFNLGVGFLWKWLFRFFSTVPFLEYLVVMCIFLIIAINGYVWGVGAGVIISVIIFAARYSKVPVYSNIVSLTHRRSMVDRSSSETATLNRIGQQAQIIRLKGLLFFGTAFRLKDIVRESLNSAKVLIFDFKKVEGIDVSACQVLQKIVGSATANKKLVIFSNLQASVRAVLLRQGIRPEKNRVYFFHELNEALELCERTLLANNRKQSNKGESFEQWLSAGLGTNLLARQFKGLLVQRHFKADQILCEQGSPADKLYFVEAGRFEAWYEAPNTEPTLVRVSLPNTLIGDMGFFGFDDKRNATIVAVEDSSVYVLSRERYEYLRQTRSDLSSKLLEIVLRVVIQRVKVQTDLIAIYED